MYPFSTLKNDTLVSVLYKLNLVTGKQQNQWSTGYCTIPSLISVSTGRENVRSHDIAWDKVVLTVIPFSSLLNTHRNISPGSVGGRLPGVNDMLTCSRPWLSVGLAHDHLHSSSSPGMELTLLLTQTEVDQTWQCSYSCSDILELSISWFHCCSDTVTSWNTCSLHYTIHTEDHYWWHSYCSWQSWSMSPEETAQPDSSWMSECCESISVSSPGCLL